MKDLTKGNIYKTFFLFGLPLVLSGLLSQMYGVIDTAIAGRVLGDTGLAAIGATAPLIRFISSLFWGYGVGFSVYIARLFGAKEYGKIKSAVCVTYLLMFAVCALVCTFLIVFYKQVFALLQVDESLYDVAFEYFLFYIIGLFPIILTSNGVYIMTAMGIGSFPFYMSLISTVLNIGGNLLAVVVFEIGIKGLAIASVFAALVVDVCYVLKFISCLKEMGVEKEKVNFSIKPVKNSLPYALPNMVQQMVMYFASLLISPLVNGLGLAASASYSVVTRVYDINAAVYQNSARSISNYSAQCMGKGKQSEIKKGVGVGLLQGVAFVTPFVLACCIFHEPICSLFLKADADALTREYAYMFAREYLPFIYINLVCNLFHGLYRGVKATGHLFGTTLIGAAARFVCSLLLMPSMGMRGFYLGWVLSWAIEAIVSFVLYLLGGWLKKDREN